MKKSELRELIREQVRNLIKEASVSQEAYIIHSITKCGQDAAQNFIDDNKLDGKKLAAYVRQHSNSKEKYDVRDIIAGTGVGANVGFKSRFLKQFKESVIKEAKEYSFTFDYNTDPDDIEYIENLLKKARVNAYAEQGTFDDEMVVIAGDAIELRKAKKAIEADGFQINESTIKENEHLDLSKWKIGDTVEFSNGEIWKVAKPGYKRANDSIFLAPFNAIAKKGHISLPIEFTADELTNTVTESITEAASDISYINKARAKSSLEQIKKGKRSDGMGKFDAKVYAIKGTQEIELTDPADLAKYSVGYKYGLKNESVLKEADMTRMYDGFKVLNDKTKKLTKFRYVKGRKNTDVENEAIAKLMKATGLPRPNFGVHGFVRKGEWELDKAEIFKEAVLKEFGPLTGSGNSRANELDTLKRDAAKKSERGETVYVVGAKNGSYKLSKYFEKGNTYAAFYNGMPQVVEGITEASITEDAGMVVDVAMGVAAGLMGLWALVQSAPLVGRVFGDAAEYLANKSEKKAKMALKNQRKETIAPIIAKFKNDTRLADMYQNLTPYTKGLTRNQILDNKDRKRQLITIGNYIKAKLTPEEMQYFTDVSSMLRDGDLRESVLTENQLTASVISVGIINMTNGKTAHGWSIYENKGLYAFLTSGNYLLLAAKDSFKVGDEVELVGNDSGRRLSKKHKIVDISECIKDELLKMLKSNGFDYSPLRAFKARPAGNKKLQTSFSVKGIQ